MKDINRMTSASSQVSGMSAALKDARTVKPLGFTVSKTHGKY